jgi:regulator of sirC expression with transglutaminase-like and TPR domain
MSGTDRPDARQRFLELASGESDRIELAEAALWIAAERYPDLDVATYCARIDALADQVRPRIGGARNAHEQVEVLNAFLFDECAFRGNQDDYYDPRNSYLNDLLDRRVGIPISLAILWISVARRLGLDAHGVGFPGHFLATISPTLVDCYAGRIVSPEECHAILERNVGPGAQLDLRMFGNTPSNEILARLLRNLKQVFIHQSELAEALACSDRIVILQPEIAQEVRDRGLLYRALECWSDARADFEHYLAMAPEAADAEKVRAILLSLGNRKTRLH